MVENFANQHWMLIALIFFGILGYIAWIRQRDQRWIEKKFNHEQIMTASFGIIYLGVTSDEGPIRRRSGFLILTKERLFYRSRRAGLELDIPGDKLLKVYHDVRHRGEEIHQSLMMVDFINKNKKKDTAAFRVPYPPQWIQAVQATLKG
ncbi:hypothetical protein KKI24_31130 [bacterium]|nr:hypothetical protein [bacterium]